MVSNNKVFETVSFHLVKPCNMKCKFCYATFDDFKVSQQLSLDECKLIIDKLAAAGVQKITFAGGEPMLFKKLNELIRYTYLKKITTSIITNGSLLTEKWLDQVFPMLDWIGISIDSIDRTTNKKIGRTSRNKVNYFQLMELIKRYNFKIKINTVVNSYNWKEDMSDFISWVSPDRWKIFQALRVKGQNDDNWNEIKITSEQFTQFVDTHTVANRHNNMVVENNEMMTGSYLLIDPLGRLFENSKGEHTYSESILNIPVKEALKQIVLNRNTFLERGGIYNWK